MIHWCGDYVEYSDVVNRLGKRRNVTKPHETKRKEKDPFRCQQTNVCVLARSIHRSSNG